MHKDLPWKPLTRKTNIQRYISVSFTNPSKIMKKHTNTNHLSNFIMDYFNPLNRLNYIKYHGLLWNKYLL